MSDWQTMDSAPKDGSFIVVTGTLPTHTKERGVFVRMARYHGSWMGESGSELFFPLEFWTHLPTPPKDIFK